MKCLNSIKRHKKLISFISVLSLAVVCAISASAYSYSYTTSRDSSSSHENYDNSTYYLKTEYHVGSTFPYDDAYIYAEAGATVFNMRKVYYNFGHHTSGKASFSAIGSGVQTISTGYTISGQDTGTGYCWGTTYAGRSTSNSVDKSQKLSIS